MELPDAETWTRIDTLLAKALDRPPGERIDFLQTACPDEPELREAVNQLLESEDRVPDFLEGDAIDLVLPLLPEVPSTLTDAGARGRRIGPYRLIDKIGRGGMSAVFRAERTDTPYQQQVALKLLPPSLASDALARRFEQEQQIMASLNHPYIAKLLDGGVTEGPAEQPYFVMEYVEGRPIDAYCRDEQLPVDERLALFETVGEAVQHAHRNLVVHRDLKPSNVLITDDGTPKLLDFGIAKLLADHEMPVERMQTRTGDRWLTLPYAAPEQIRGEAMTTATDVYQLGVLAYELLTGHRPYEAAERSPFEVERAVLEETPTRPSSMVRKRSSVGDFRSDNPDPEALARRLRGDLDAILRKALRKDPSERYASMETLLRDLDRYREDRPIEARTPTMGYRIRKFAGRYRSGLLASVAGLLVVMGFIVALLHQRGVALTERNRAQAEAQTAEQVSAFLVDLFEAGDPATSAGGPVTAQELLDRGRQRIGRLNDQPAVQAGLLGAMGRAYQGLGRYDSARTMLERSVALRRRVHEANHPEVATSLDHLADVYAEERDFESALPRYRDALAIRRAALGTDHPKTATSMHGLAGALRNMGKPDSAITLAKQAVQTLHQHHQDSTHPEVLEAQHTLAYALRAAGRYKEGASLYRRVLEHEKARHGAGDQELAGTHNDFAYLLKQQGNYAAAVDHYRQALQIRRKVLGPAHPKTTLVMQNLAGTLWEMERYDEVESTLRARVDALQNHAPTDSTRLGGALGGLGRFLAERGRFEEAIPPKRAVYQLYREHRGANALYTICQSGELGALLKAVGRDAAADSLLRRHYTVLQARRDTIVRHRDRYTRLDVRYSLRAMVKIFEQRGLTELAQRYDALRTSYTASSTS